MSNYLESPVLPIVATSCACCGLPLVDAISVERGIGPVCRRKHRFEHPDKDANWARVAVLCDDWHDHHNPLPDACMKALVAQDGQALVNALAYYSAVHAGQDLAARAAQIMAAAGYVTFASKVAEHAGAAPVRAEVLPDGRIAVHTPYKAQATDAWRAIASRRWDGTRKANTVAPRDWPAVLALLDAHYPLSVRDLPEVAEAPEEAPKPLPRCVGTARQGTRYRASCVACGATVPEGQGWAFRTEAGRWAVVCGQSACGERVALVRPELPSDLPARMSAEEALRWLGDHGISVELNAQGLVRVPGGRECRGCYGTGRYAGTRGRCAACGGKGQTRETWITPQVRARKAHAGLVRRARNH